MTGLVAPAIAGTFGTVVPIGGHASDLALDEARGVVYVANYTANRIDVVSTTTKKIQTNYNVSRQPASLALSPDGRYLAITHVSNFEDPAQAYKGLTLIDLSANGAKQTFTFGNAPLGVAFGQDGKALVLTTGEVIRFDPKNGYMQNIATVQQVTSAALPQQLPTSPRDILRASLTASGDGTWIFGIAELNDDPGRFLLFQYSVLSQSIGTGYWVSAPPMGPRVVSTDREGTVIFVGWALFLRQMVLLAQYPGSEGTFGVGSHAVDRSRGVVYGQFKTTAEDSATLDKTLAVADIDNLAIRERLKLAENLSGRSVLSANGDVMYAISDSGLSILPVGSLDKQHRVTASVEDLVFKGQWCDRRSLSQTFTITNPGGGKTDFSLSSEVPGVLVEQSSSTTPATVRVTLDMTTFQNNKGTTAGNLVISSGSAVNLIPPVRLLVNNREPDQRGSFFNVPGKLVDVKADPIRNRFYVLRQDKNEVLVFDGSNYRQIGSLKTGNTPWSMAITTDGRYLLVGADNSQVMPVYDLETLRFSKYVIFPLGHYPRSVAVSNRAILASTRVAGDIHTVDRVDLTNGYAATLPSLGVFANDISADSMLASSPSGTKILLAEANGRVLLYDARSDTFVAGREDFDDLKGAVAALTDDFFVVENHVLNASLVSVTDLESASGLSSGFALVDGAGLRTTAPNSSSAGVAQRVNLTDPTQTRSARMAEAPILGTEAGQFTPSLAPLANGSAIISLSTSGFTVLPWNYDAAIADPKINAVVNAADSTKAVAPGGLISIYGTSLSPVNASTATTPLPTLLGDSCLTVNGTLVPLLFVSPLQINGQLPFNATGSVTITLHTPSGVSNDFAFSVQSTAPGVFRADIDGLSAPVPTVVRASNNLLVTLANPVHLDDWLVIYLTGLGKVTPDVADGAPGPTDPLAEADIQPVVTLGGVSLPVGYAGLVPNSVGLYQINVKVPFRDVPTGMEIPLKITQEGYSTSVNVRVVK